MMNTTNHLMLEPPLKENLMYGFYEGGHMMRISQMSLVKLQADLVQFYATGISAPAAPAATTDVEK